MNNTGEFHVSVGKVNKVVDDGGASSQAGRGRPGSNVEPGDELQVDFGELGRIHGEEPGKRRRVWALVFTPAISRYSFIWLVFSQNLVTVIDVFEAAWEFKGGVFRVVVPNNMATGSPTPCPISMIPDDGFP